MKIENVLKKIMPKKSEKLLCSLKSEKAHKIYNILNVIKNVACWSILILLVFTVIVFLTSRLSGNDPTFFGYSVYRVSSGSMEPEIMTGDVILSKSVDDIFDIKTGDVITFDGTGELEGKTVTHKVIKAPYTDENGNVMLQTKGVANETEDKPISADRVRSRMVCEIPFLTVLYNLFLSMWGFIIFIILLLLIFFDEIVNIVRILSGNDDGNETHESIGEIIERIKAEEQIKQLEAETNNEQEKPTDSIVKNKESGNAKKADKKPVENKKKNKSSLDKKKTKSSKPSGKNKSKGGTNNYPHKKKKKKKRKKRR